MPATKTASKPKTKPKPPAQRYIYLLRDHAGTIRMVSTVKRDVGQYVYAKVPENQRKGWDVARCADGGEMKDAKIIGSGFEVMVESRGK